MKPLTASGIVANTYEPLPEGDFIRLMHLQPALNVDAPLRFTFSIGHVQSLVARYEAISYTWGEPILNHPLHIGATCILATKNLDKALRRLRLPTTPRALWADAVCINQKDDQEKSRQIPLMSGIFRSANRVLAWLDGGKEEERGMQVLNSLSRESLPALYESGTDVQPSERDVIGKFLGLPWFTRLWIIQEVVMNADVMLICRSTEVSWLRLTIALSVCANRYRPKPALVDSDRLEVLLHVAKLWTYHNMTTESTKELRISGQSGMLELVNKFLAYGCSDPRDRIFALYNVATDIRPTFWRDDKKPMLPLYQPKKPIDMDIDYSLDVRQVYQNFAAACISGGRGNDIFEAVLQRVEYQNPQDWPSWAPDWRRPKSSYWIHLRTPPPPQNRWWNYAATVYQLIGSPPDVLSVLWRRNSGLSPIQTINTILAFPRASSVSSMVSSLRAQLAACPTPLVDCLLEQLGLGETHSLTLDDGTLTRTWESYQTIRLPLWMEFEAQGPRLFMVNSSTPSDILLGVGSTDLLEGDEVALYDSPDRKPGALTEHCLLIRNTGVYSDTNGNRILSHRLIGTAQIVRFSNSSDGWPHRYDQKVTLYLR